MDYIMLYREISRLFLTLSFRTMEQNSARSIICLKQPSCIYFARPYTPTDKPQAERLNRQHRQYFQKGELRENLSPADIYKVMTIINNKPVKSLNWVTPSEYFNAVLAQINTQLDLEAIALYVNETSGKMRTISPNLV